MIGTTKTIWNHGTIVQVLVVNRRTARRCKVARDGQSITFVP